MPFQKKRILYRIVRKTVSLFYKKREFLGLENLPSGGCVVVGNHSKTHGPIMAELYFPTEKYIWCAGQMMSVKEAPTYTFEDFWAQKPRRVRWIYKILSYVIAPVSAYLFSRADCIKVYKDMRVMATYKDSVKGLEEGRKIIIYPEHHQPYNNIINDFQTRYVDVAKIYYKKNRKPLAFVPMYHAVKLKQVVFGKPIYYNPDNTIELERGRINDYLKEEITRLAESLPRHLVVPYENIPKRKYLSNLQGKISLTKGE